MEKLQTVALFGEAEKGDFQAAYFCDSLSQLVESLGNPPPASYGLDYAVQALMYRFNLLFFRVREEGFSYQDYLVGFHILEQQKAIPNVAAVCLPGVGDSRILKAATPFCINHQAILITREADLYDYLTSGSGKEEN